MSRRDVLLAGIVVGFVLMTLFIAWHDAGDPELPIPVPSPSPGAPSGLEDRLASVEARMRRIEDALERMEKRLEKTVEGSAEETVAPAVDPRAAEPLGLDELRRMGIDIPDLGNMRGVRLGGGESPAKELARALDLTDDQRGRVRDILDEFKGSVDDKLPAPGRPGDGARVTGGPDTTGALRKLQAKLVKKLAKVLDKEQRGKLDEFVAKRGLPIAGTNTVWRFRETPGGGVAVTSTSVRGTNNNVRIEMRTDDAGAPPPPRADGDVGDPAGVF